MKKCDHFGTFRAMLSMARLSPRVSLLEEQVTFTGYGGRVGTLMKTARPVSSQKHPYSPQVVNRAYPRTTLPRALIIYTKNIHENLACSFITDLNLA